MVKFADNSLPDVSVVGFLDEGLLVNHVAGNKRVYLVSVVGFLDEGLLVSCL